MTHIQNLDPFDALREELKSYRHCFSVNEVNEITLLSIEDVMRLPKDILTIKKWWWLQSPSLAHNLAAYVYSDGNVNELGNFVNYDDNGVRPVFRINNLKLPFGEKVYAEKTQCTVIGEGLLLSDSIVCRHRFDIGSNDWKTSELKRFIESEEFKNLL